jgi:hypothetical protein
MVRNAGGPYMGAVPVGYFIVYNLGLSQKRIVFHQQMLLCISVMGI